MAKNRDKEKKYILLFHSFQQLVDQFQIEEKYHPLIKNNENTFTTMLIPSKQNKIAARIPGDKNLLHFLKLVNLSLIHISEPTRHA